MKCLISLFSSFCSKKTFFHVCKIFLHIHFSYWNFNLIEKKESTKKTVCLLFHAVRTISLSVWCHSPLSVSHNHTLFLSQSVVSFPIFFRFFFLFCSVRKWVLLFLYLIYTSLLWYLIKKLTTKIEKLYL